MANRDEAKVRLVIDGSQAEAELAKVTRSAEEKGRRISSKVGAAIRGGVAAFGVGAVAGAGFRAVQGRVSGGVSDVASEAFTGWLSRLEESLLGDTAIEARAGRKAREELLSNFSFSIGLNQGWSKEQKAWFESVKSRRLVEEKGIRWAEQNVQGTSLAGLFDKAIDSIGKMLKEAAEHLGRFLLGGGRDAAESARN